MTVRLYTRRGCHLCEAAEAALARLRDEYPHALERFDVDDDPRLAARYGLTVPVVVVARRWVLAGRVDEAGLREALARAAG
ncbi:MAG: glutaredoxin family protein [Armatimonadetes bacterium]|nr:glutaredoxin family protein [Armatimonadota bacterium]